MKCGSTYVDRHFRDLMGRRFGRAFDDLPMERKGPGSPFMEDFQRIKHNFRASDSETKGIHLEMDLDMDEIDSTLYDFDDKEVLVSR